MTGRPAGGGASGLKTAQVLEGLGCEGSLPHCGPRRGSGAPRDDFGSTRKYLVVLAGIGGGPVEIFLRQHIPPELAIIGHPIRALIIVHCPKDGCLVSPELWTLVGEPCH